MARRLAAVECRAVTYLGDDFPVFWRSGSGMTVADVDDNVYLDLSGAFGVSVLGHGSPVVQAAVADQAGRLAHGMGDVHPPSVKVELAERLVAYGPFDEARVLFGLSGSDAVEAALKTAMVATGRRRAIAFEGAYHGLSLGALDLTHRQDFRGPFAGRLAGATDFLPFPTEATVGDVLERAAALAPAAALAIVEPIQGRGGVRTLPAGFLARLADVCREAGCLLALDEVLTGFGRTGRPFACQDEGVVPDLLAVGKALGGGLPISACLGRPEVMDRWPVSTGEAIHTSTFLGHPLAAAAALAVLDELEAADLPGRARRLGDRLAGRLAAAGLEVGGRGLLRGVVVGPGRGPAIMVRALRLGLIVLPCAADGSVLSLTPPLNAPEADLERAIELLLEAVVD